MSWRDGTCYTDGGVFIPMCWGSTIYGKHECTCDRARAKKDQIDRLERRVEKLERMLNASPPRPPTDHD